MTVNFGCSNISFDTIWSNFDGLFATLMGQAVREQVNDA
jgi:hypothetical protein